MSRRLRALVIVGIILVGLIAAAGSAAAGGKATPLVTGGRPSPASVA